jgi:subtilase family serine protease
VVDHRLGNVLSQSFGESETCVDPKILKAQHRAFAEGVAKGMTIFASSGDDGAAQPSCDGSTFIQSASSPASDPLVTAVGGTSLTATQPDGTYVSETAWNDQFGASGGGFSTIYRRPFYQNGVVHNSGRGVPDVAYSGDVNNGLLIAWSQGVPANVGDIFIFGGTSAGSPQWAAMTALVDSVFGPQGDINPLLYLFVSHANHVFHDITTGNNSVVEQDANGNAVTINGFPATRGWDAVTGLGSIDLGNALLGSGRSGWSHHAITN